MKRCFLLAVVAAASAVGPSPAIAGVCGLPDSTPTWIDFGAPELHDVFGRPGIVVATSTGEYPARVRASGAKTIYWDMHLRNRVGTPTAPTDPTTIEDRAHRLFTFAATQSACPTPWIILNELFGAHLATPWSPSNAQYRANVLTLVRELARRGARPMLLVSRRPYTGTPEAADWWRELARVSDIVLEVYFSAPGLWREGPVAANRRMRIAFRRAVGSLTGIGIPVSRIGLTLGFQVAPGTGGREGLRPTSAWLEVVKWHALAAKRVAGEMKIASVVSWGWGTWSAAGTDQDKPRAACVYLWARNPRLCNGPAVAGEDFNPSRREGQLILPSGAQCLVGNHPISMSAISRVTQYTDDREVATSALYRRVVETRRYRVIPRRVLITESSIVRLRFGGNRAAYIAALARLDASVKDARAIIGDQLRVRAIASRLSVPRPSKAAVRTFYFQYPDVLTRFVRVNRGPWWLDGRRSGVAISPFAPQQLFSVPVGRRLTLHDEAGPYRVRAAGGVKTLGAVPLSVAHRSIAAGLHSAAEADAAIKWSAREQEAMHRVTTCRRDQLPQVTSVELWPFAPFLAVRG